MKRMMLKGIVICLFMYSIILIVNYKIDPANLFHDATVREMTEQLEDGVVVYSHSQYDERLFQISRISAIDKNTEVILLGGSHVLYGIWEFEDYYNTAMSGAIMEDIYGVVGIMLANNIEPEKVIICIDPWMFNDKISESRYKSIINYVEYAKHCILFETAPSEADFGIEKWNKDKVLELLSFSYFQESINAWITTNHDEKIIAKSEEIEEIAKICPSGRRIPSYNNMKTGEQCRMEAINAINSNSVYLVSGFVEIADENKIMFEKLIDYFIKKDIEVELYFPPWHPEYYEEFKKNKDYIGVLEVEKYVRKYAETKGILVRGTYDPELVYITQDDFMDSLHLKPEKVWETFEMILE